MDNKQGSSSTKRFDYLPDDLYIAESPATVTLNLSSIDWLLMLSSVVQIGPETASPPNDGGWGRRDREVYERLRELLEVSPEKQRTDRALKLCTSKSLGSK